MNVNHHWNTRRRVLLALFLLGLTLATGARAQGTVFVEDDRVGIGADSPDATLHVVGQGDTRLIVEDLESVAASRVLMELSNHGKLRFLLKNTEKDTSWTFDNSGAFTVSLVGSGLNELRLSETGNLTIAGNLTEGSSVTRKENLVAVDPTAILDRVLALPLREWSYGGQKARHLGPMAEDFHQAFGLGDSPTGLAALDTGGVALAAIQGLSQRLEEEERYIASLERQLQSVNDQRLRDVERLEREIRAVTARLEGTVSSSADG